MLAVIVTLPTLVQRIFVARSSPLRVLSSMSAAADDGAAFAREGEVAAMLAAAEAADTLRAREAAAMLGSAADANDEFADDEPDWVRARAEQEDQAFHAKRDNARVTRAAAWLDEERALRAAEASRQFDTNKGAEPSGANWGARSHVDRGAAWMDEERAIRAAEAAAMLGGPSTEPMADEQTDVVAAYEARMRALDRRPKTAAEKREEYAQDQIRQIAEADAMDERLARTSRAARESE